LGAYLAADVVGTCSAVGVDLSIDVCLVRVGEFPIQRSTNRLHDPGKPYRMMVVTAGKVFGKTT
jgi:hypothetical protein